MPQKPPAKAPRGIWSQATAPRMQQKPVAKGAARDLEAGYCLTSLSEATRKALGRRPECRKSLRRRRREAVEARLLPPRMQQQPVARAPRGICMEAGYCLTSLSEATRKALWKAPRMPQKPPAKAPRGSWSQATAPRMQQQPVARAPRGIWRQATA